jgi:hypothetical protein
MCCQSIFLNTFANNIQKVIQNQIVFLFLLKKQAISLIMNSYARPDVRYCRDYFHSNVNKVCLEFWRPDCWHFSSEKTDWRERASAPDRQSSHERNVNSKGQQNDKKPCYILNVNSPVGKSHLVVHMCFYFAPKKYINL